MDLDRVTFSASAWNATTGKCIGGFILVNSEYKIVCAGFSSARLESKVDMETMVLLATLRLVDDEGGRCSNIYTNSMEHWSALYSNKEANF